MRENTPEEMSEDSDSENEDSTGRILVHVFVLGALAVVAMVLSRTHSDPGTMLPLDGLFSKVVWLGFAAHALLSSLGLLFWRGWGGLVGVHVVAGVLALPAAGFLITLL